MPWERQKHTVQPVHNASVAGQQIARVLDTSHPLEHGFDQVSQLTCYSQENTEQNKHPRGDTVYEKNPEKCSRQNAEEEPPADPSMVFLGLTSS